MWDVIRAVPVQRWQRPMDPNKIATEDAKQILNQKFNHFNN